MLLQVAPLIFALIVVKSSYWAMAFFVMILVGLYFIVDEFRVVLMLPHSQLVQTSYTLLGRCMSQHHSTTILNRLLEECSMSQLE